MTETLLALCRWPQLAEPHSGALRDAVAFTVGETDPIGIIATGTVIRGGAHPASDIDLYVIHRAPYRRRVQRFFRTVPVEIFINPPEVVRSYFPSEHRNGRRSTAHMLATGFVVLEHDPIVEQLRSESRDWLARPDECSSADAQRARYAAATHLEDGADITAEDPAVASLILGRAVTLMLEYRLRSSGHPIPRAKTLVTEVAALDPALGDMVCRFTQAVSPAARLDAAQRIGDHVLHARGFFEWDSGPEPVAPGSGSPPMRGTGAAPLATDHSMSGPR